MLKNSFCGFIYYEPLELILLTFKVSTSKGTKFIKLFLYNYLRLNKHTARYSKPDTIDTYDPNIYKVYSIILLLHLHGTETILPA